MKFTFTKMFGPDLGGDSGGDPQLGLEPSPNVEPPANTPPPIDYSAIGKSMAAELKGILPQSQPAQASLTPEEAAKRLNLWAPDDGFLQKFGNIDTQKEAFLAMRDGMTKQNYTIMQMMLQEAREQIAAEFNPIREAYQEQQAAARESRFNAAYAELANPAFKPVIGAVIQSLQAQQHDFSNEEKTFTAIAKGVEAVIQSQNPEFKLTGGKSPTKKPGNANALAPNTSGAGVGGGVAGGNGGATSVKGHALKYL